MTFIIDFINNTWEILQELTPWLLFGLLLAGIVHVFLPEGFINRHLGGKKFLNVFKAVTIGIPMPLCSCGVIPAAVGLKKDGASDGASMGFLISTPQTGVDSILVSGGFLGWPFAFFKVACALVSGLVGGWLVNFTEKKTDTPDAAESPASDHAADTSEKDSSENASCCHHCCSSESSTSESDSHEKASPSKWHDLFYFSFDKLLDDIYKWLLVGVVAAGLITTLVPTNYFAESAWLQGPLGLIVVMLVSVPMYVCSTASVPLAAALVSIGMSPGAALVFLTAGPTTNIATVGMVYRTFGKRILAIYLATVFLMSMAAGLFFDNVLSAGSQMGHHAHTLPQWVAIASTVILAALIARLLIKGRRSTTKHAMHP